MRTQLLAAIRDGRGMTRRRPRRRRATRCSSPAPAGASRLPATEDLAALTAAGENPTVMAFALGRRGGLVVYEVLNQPEPMTFVYRAEGADGLAAINRALDNAGFLVSAVHAEGLAAQAWPGARPSPLARALAAKVPHDARWPDRIAGLPRD
jgi:hypothetical protein